MRLSALTLARQIVTTLERRAFLPRIAQTPRSCLRLQPQPTPTTNLIQNISARFSSNYRSDCRTGTMPRCSEANLKKTKCKKLKDEKRARRAKKAKKAKKSKKGKSKNKKHSKDPCKKKVKEEGGRSGCSDPDERQTPKSMWLNPECCLEPCKDMLPRFDELYYKPSDKLKRKYQQTWVECPRLKLKKKKICCYENLKFPKFKKRKRKEIPKTACAQMGEDNNLMKCKKMKASTCPKIKMPRCRGVRYPPKCKGRRAPTICTKICTPYPSFSECVKKKPKELRKSECECYEPAHMCEVLLYARKKGIKIKR